MLNDIEVMSKTFCVMTMLFSLYLLYLAWMGRKKNLYIRSIFIIYTILTPSYILDAGIYIIDYPYNLHVGYFSWATINTLSLATQTMLVGYIIKQDKAD